MNWKRLPNEVDMLAWLVVLAVGYLVLGGWDLAAASTLTMVTTPVKNISGAVKEVGFYIAPLLLVGTIFHARQGGVGMATLIEIVLIILVIAVVVYADEIIAWIRPGAAAASVLVPAVSAPVVVWQEFGGQLLTLAAMTLGIRRVRRS